jgi:hypothetical protein
MKRDELVEALAGHYGDTAKLTLPQVREMALDRRDGLHADLLTPPRAARIFRGLEDLSPSVVARLADLRPAALDASGAGYARLTEGLHASGDRDRSWSLSRAVAERFARSDYLHRKPSSPGRLDAVLVGEWAEHHLVLDPEAVADLPELSRVRPARWRGSSAADAVREEREVCAAGPVRLLAVSYSRRDVEGGLSAALDAALSSSGPARAEARPEHPYVTEMLRASGLPPRTWRILREL